MTNKMTCVACKKPINQKPRIMKLQITSEDPKFGNRARKLGFTSGSWRMADSMEGWFHKDCFNTAMLIWEVAFETRAVSPRRQ
jgi:hypothetical protein